MKKLVAITSVLIVAISVSVVVFFLVSNKQEESNIEESLPVESTTESLYDSANASVSDSKEVIRQEDYFAYISSAEEALYSVYGNDFPEMNLMYVETIDTGIKNHVFEVEHTDIIVNVCVDSDGMYSLIGPCNRYGSDYAAVWFDVEPVSRVDVYDYLFEVASVDSYRFDSNQILTNLNTGETYNYGEYAGTAATPEPEPSTEQSDVGANDAESTTESGSSEFSAG